MQVRPVRVLVVGMFDSVHFSKWLMHFRDDRRLEFLLFPSSPHRRHHPYLDALIHQGDGANYRVVQFADYIAIPLWLLDRFLSKRISGLYISSLVKRFSPHFVHALELQNAGYAVLWAKKSIASVNAKLICTNYGSDLFWFQRFRRHKKRIKSLLSITDKYAAECDRDVVLARKFGFVGQIMPVNPNAGGFSADELSTNLKETSTRGKIAVKGYHGWVGRALIAIKALEILQDKLQEFEIVFYSCNLVTKRAINRLKKRTGLNVLGYGKGALNHSEMLKLFSETRVYLGLSLSDGISTSMLEAMAMGAIPVQTSSACSREWFSETGVHVDTLEPTEVANAITRALEISSIPEAVETNRETLRKKACNDNIRLAALEFYTS